MPTKPRIPLSRERVLDAAIAIADESGIASLTMRKLARELGVEAMSLYNHVANKGDLVDSMVDRVVGEFELPSEPRWDEAIRLCAISAHETLLRHPWACSLAISVRSTPTTSTPRFVYMDWLMRRLREAGFSAALTYHAYHALDSHILGFTFWDLGHSGAARAFEDDEFEKFAATFLPQLRAAGLEYLAEHAEQHLSGGVGGESEFEFGLDLILDGLRRARAAE